MNERSELASNSTSSSRLLTKSPMLTMPRSRPSATTGKWRIRRLVISAIKSPTLSPGSQVTTLRVMISSTLRDRRSARWSASAMTMSRSDRMPSTPAPSSLTTMAPIRSLCSMSTASAIVASGRIVATQMPLLRRIVSTFIGGTPRLRGRRRAVAGPGKAPSAHKIGQNVAPGKGSTRNRSLGWLDGFRLDPVVGVEADQILDFLAQRSELGIADAGVAAGRDDLGQRALHEMHRDAEQDLGIDASAIAHRLQFAQRQDRPPVAVAAALHPDERHCREPRRRRGLLMIARKHQPEIGADLGGGVDAMDRLLETELAAGVGTRDDHEIRVGFVALAAGVFDLGD